MRILYYTSSTNSTHYVLRSHGLQIALASGANVIATSSSDEKLKIVTKLGAQHVINYKTTPEWDEKVLELTGGRGVDHVLEVRFGVSVLEPMLKKNHSCQVGGPETLAKCLKAIRIGGWIHTIGFVGGVCTMLMPHIPHPLNDILITGRARRCGVCNYAQSQLYTWYPDRIRRSVSTCQSHISAFHESLLLLDSKI